MSFLKKILKAFPDKYITGASGANLATIASVNNVVEESNAALDLVADKVIIPAGNSSADLPPITLKKTSTSFTYPDGTKLQGYSILGSALLSGQSTYSIPQCTLTIPCVVAPALDPSVDEEELCLAGFYIAYKTTGAIKCMVNDGSEEDPTEFEIVNDFSSGADLRRDSDGQAQQTAYVGLFLEETEAGSGIYTVSLDVEAGAGAGPSSGEVFYQFEFLVYDDIIPSIS